MIMKKILFILSLCSLTACKDVLKEEPKGLFLENFYNTPAEVEAAVNAVYAPLHSDNCMGAFYPAQLETYSDLLYGRGSYNFLNSYTVLDPTNTTRIGLVWESFYTAIRNANLVIQKAPLGKNLTAAEVDRYVGEARFMRAFVYYQLVQNWIEVPLRTEANMVEPALKLSSAADLYKFILADLQDAELKLPDVPRQAGRPTKWAAKTLLAQVMMHDNTRWAEARNKLDEVIKSRKYSLVPVTSADDFLNLYGPRVVTTPEEVFYLKFSASSNQGWLFIMFPHHPGAKYHGAGGYYAHYTDPELGPPGPNQRKANATIKSWDAQDLRKAYNLYPYVFGEGPTTLLNRKFRDPEASNINAAGNDYPLYRYADVLLLYAEAASRAAGGPTPEAVEALNQVHRRAYGLPANTPAPSVDFKAADYTAETFLDLILRERGFETMYEGKRWLDLKRMGIPTLKRYILAAEGRAVADGFLRWPIPSVELTNNPALRP